MYDVLIHVEDLVCHSEDGSRCNENWYIYVDQQVWKFDLMIQVKVWCLKFSVDHKVPKINNWK